MANNTDRIQIPVSKDFFGILSAKITNKAYRAVFGDVVLRPPYPNHSRPYTQSWIRQVTGISSNVVAKDYLKGLLSQQE